MNYTDQIIDVTRQIRGVTREHAQQVVELYLASVAEELATGELVTLPSIGKLRLMVRPNTGRIVVNINGTAAPLITLGHWVRAQQIAEDWHRSVHHLLDALNRSEDSLTETRVFEQLIALPEGATLCELTQRTGFRRESIEDALKALLEAGLVSSERQRRGERGPEAHMFLAVKQ